MRYVRKAIPKVIQKVQDKKLNKLINQISNILNINCKKMSDNENKVTPVLIKKSEDQDMMKICLLYTSRCV